MYSHIISIDEELRDIIEDGIDIPIDEEGVAIDRKKHTAAQKKLYKKHQKVRRIIVAALSHKEYLKLGDKSTDSAMFKSFLLLFNISLMTTMSFLLFLTTL
jgi:hypothetical protein